MTFAQLKLNSFAPPQIIEEKRIQDILLSVAMGPIFPLWGVIGVGKNLLCGCGDFDCSNPGKHPRWSDWKRRATSDLNVILSWIKYYPYDNFGAVMGVRAIAVDLDRRPESDKDGPAEFDRLILGVGGVPTTVSVRSGRNNGSRHIYFKTPESHVVKWLSSPFHGVDLIKKGYCVTPGSRHISGAYYSFEPGSSSGEHAVAELPNILLEYFTKDACDDLDIEARPPEHSLDAPPTDLLPGRLLPDTVVLRQVARDRVAGPLFRGVSRFSGSKGAVDRSKDGYALASKLAFYTAHNWDQYVSLWQKSAQAGQKNSSWLGGDYEAHTLRNAFASNRHNWQRKSLATGAAKGRKQSPITQAVLALHEQEPELNNREVASRAGTTNNNVSRILSRYRDRSTPQPSDTMDVHIHKTNKRVKERLVEAA